MRERQQSTTTYPIAFLLVASADHVTAVTGAAPSVSVSKNGAAFGGASGAVTELANGWYSWAGNATDRATLGGLAVHITAATADPADFLLTIVPWDPFDGVRLGLTALPNAAAEAAGGLYTRGSGAGQINQPANGRVDANAIALSGTTLTARDIGASVLLSAGAGAGQLDFTSGVVKANLAQILGTVLTETSGLLAAGFKKFFNVATPTGTLNSLPGAVPGAAGGGFIAGANAATTVDITGNLSGSVGSVTGGVTVGSYAAGEDPATLLLATPANKLATDASGQVMVASIVNGAIVAATFAANALDAAWSTTARTITGGTITTNSDKTGYALSTGGVQAIWDALTSALTTVGSAGKLLVDNLDAKISTRLATGGYTVPPTANENADAVLDRADAVETGVTPRGSLRLMLAALAGKLSGASGTTVTIRNVGDTKDRITATVDSSGDRTAVTTDAS